MDLWIQYAAAGLIVAGAGLYLARRAWRRAHRPAGSCGGDCGCAAESPQLGTRRELFQVNLTGAKDAARGTNREK